MKAPRNRELHELNQSIVKRKRGWTMGMLDAANAVNEAGFVAIHGNLLGDVLLFKRNLITKRQVRRNPDYR